ncbi:Cna B-type domain-containing protein [Melissococcus sp. OM08-11BH]|nr:Cna B-type domain-containing protein [Melissococcus sp. OM08-11BH]
MDISVTKYWKDNQDKHNTRPTSIKVQLYADGKKSDEAVELNEGNRWTCTWNKFVKKENGKTIDYTVKEIRKVPGYTKSVNDTNIGHIIITNTLNNKSHNSLPNTGEKNDILLFISELVILMISAIVIWYVK